MPDLANLDLVGWIALAFCLIIALAWIPVFKVLVIDGWRLLRRRPDFDPQDRERVGLSPVLADTAEREARVRRARFAHLTRTGRVS